MRQEKRTPTNDSVAQLFLKEPATTNIDQRYRDEIASILYEPHTLLPRHWNRTDPSQYAYDRDEVMALTAAYCDSSADVADLEALLMDVRKHWRVIADALGVSSQVDFVADDQPIYDLDLVGPTQETDAEITA